MNNFNKTTVNDKKGFTVVDAGNAFTFSAVFFLSFSIIYSFIVQKFNLTSNGANGSVQNALFFLSFLSAPLAVLCTLFALSYKTKQNCFLYLKPKKVSKYHVVSTALIIVGLLFGFGTINEVFIALLEKIGFTLSPITLPNYSPLNLILSVICICIIPPLTEEVLMRKIIATGLTGVSEVFAVLVGGALFSLFHMSPQQTVYQFIVGASFCYIIVKGGDWYLTFFAHVFNNLFIVLNEYFFKINYGLTLQIILTVLGLILYFLGVILLYKKGQKLSNKINKANLNEFLISVSVGAILCMVVWITSLVA